MFTALAVSCVVIKNFFVVNFILFFKMSNKLIPQIQHAIQISREITMSLVREKIKSNQFVVTSELTPPKGTNLTEMLDKAALLGECVDAINVTDSHGSKMSLSSLAAARKLVDQGIEPIMQLTARDRNRIALQGDMLGAWVLGVRNIIFMGGDPPQRGDHPEAKPVFDIGTNEIIAAAATLNDGHDMQSNTLHGNTDFHIGAVVNPGADDIEIEIEKLEAKVAAGACFFQTQAVFDVSSFKTFLSKIDHLSITLLAGIMPIKSVKMATYMNQNIPGIDVPENIINRIDQASDVVEVNLEICSEIIEDLKSICGGIHIMAPAWENNIPTLIERAGLKK